MTITQKRQPLLSVIILLFFIWGFVTLLNDLLIPILKHRLNLNYAEAMFVQFAFFFTYFIMSLPMSRLLNAVNYKKGILIGLFIMLVGCFVFIPADQMLKYGLFLFGLFILASGVVMLQVSANPLVTLLGPIKTGPARLTLAQGVNSLGYVIAPLIVGAWISDFPLYAVYLVIALIILLVGILIGVTNFSAVDSKQQAYIPIEGKEDTNFSLWHHKPFILGLIGIFIYVGSEVSAGSLVINFLGLPEVMGYSISQASFYLSFYWGFAMIGRLCGAYLLTKFSSHRLLTLFAIINVLLMLTISFSSGKIAMWSLLLVGLFNSIMFPTLFALAIIGLPSEHLKNKASGFLIMAIVGGAIIPVLHGLLADAIGLQSSFVLLILTYALIAYCASQMKSTVKKKLKSL